MKILAIETSCDETALSIIELSTDHENLRVLSDLVISQIDIHKEYGGVFPALAKREHARNLVPLLTEALKEADEYHLGSHTYSEEQLKELLEREPELFLALKNLIDSIEVPKIDMIMVTHGPGLAPALWVGVNIARALSLLWNVPVLPVNHMEGHIASILVKESYRTEENALSPLNDVSFPLMALLISGGHTQLVLVSGWNQYTIIGETIDDAVGEAFDKVARMLGLPYPGGTRISALAKEGIKDDRINLPRPMINSKDARFSFSGLKTAVRYLVEDLSKEGPLDETTKASIAREFEEAVTDVLIHKTREAMITHGCTSLIIAGGVSANTFIRSAFTSLIEKEFRGTLYLPPASLCGDNSLMIAVAGFLRFREEQNAAFTDESELTAQGNLKL